MLKCTQGVPEIGLMRHKSLHCRLFSHYILSYTH
jgi:hypothetical protein